MDKNQAYGIIANHIYVAKRMYAGDKTLIILADSFDEAKQKAYEHFGTHTDCVHNLDTTDDPQVFEI